MLIVIIVIAAAYVVLHLGRVMPATGAAPRSPGSRSHTCTRQQSPTRAVPASGSVHRPHKTSSTSHSCPSR